MKRQMKKTVLPIVILIILVISQTVSAAPIRPMDSGPVSQFVYDNFDDNVTDPSLWGIEQLGGPMVSEVNQRLEITLPANSTGTPEFKAWYLSACQLRGDYTIQVDYELLTWPDANGVRIGLADDHANMQRISSRGQPYDIDGGPDLYLTTFDVASHTVGITPTSDLSGKLRLERTGDTLSSYYFTNGAWILDASYSDPAYTQDTYFYIGSFSGDPAFAGQEVKIAFDNMIINAGELVCPHTPAPDLAITQVADQETVTVGDPMGFTITVTNNGDATANIVTLSGTLSVYPEFSWSVSGTDAAACVLTGGVLSCNFGDMPPGAVKTIRLTAPQYEHYSKCFGPITSSATVMAYNQLVNKTAAASTEVLCPNAYIEVWSDSPGVTAGDPISFNTEFGNLGDGIARNVLAETELPTNPGLSWSITNIIPAEAANNCVFGNDSYGTYELICSFDQLPAGQVVTITLTSPTTSESCGMINSVGYLTLSNGQWGRSIMKPPTVTCPQTVYDNFDDNVTDPALWSVEIKDSGPTASEVNQRLELTIPVDSTGDDFAAWYDSACQLRGDYDVQVDYELLTWPIANGVRIGLADDHANMQRISSRGQPYDIDGGPDLYLTTFDTAEHVVGITPTSDLSGKLRLQRMGNTLKSFYYTNGAWMPVASYADPAYAADTGFYLGAWSADPIFADQEVKIAFDNLIVNAGELVCSTTPAPDLVITQIADQETVSTGDPMGFTITVTNNGDATANIVTLSDILPVYPEFSWSVSGTDAAACVLTGGALSCNFGDMPPGAVKTIQLTGPEYEYHSKCFNPIITSTATVMAYNQPVNKTATASVTVLCPYALIDIDSDTFSVMAGDPVSYTFTIGNIGDGNAKDVDAFLDIQTPPGTSWAITEVTPSSAASNCTLEPDGTWTELECLFDQIAPLEESIIKVTSPTTSESCGTFGAAGGMSSSNNFWIKTKMYYLTVTCPMGDSIPVITTQPQDQALYAGDTVSFSAAASGNPAPSLQWEMSSDGGTTWSNVAGATASPLSFTTSFDHDGNQYRAVFTNIAGSATSNAATLSVSKKSATVTLANLYRPYEGQPIAATVITDPAGLSVVVTYNGSPDAPTTVGSYPVVAMINDATYQGSASGILTIQKRPAYVTPYDAYKFYGTEGPQLSGFLVNFVASDGVTATYSRTPGETVGDYTIIGSLSPNEKLANYNITYHTRTFTIKPRLVTVMADATTKVAGEPDPPLTYRITSGSLAFSDTFSGVLTRDPGEAAGTYAIRQGTLALDSNYTLTYVGADLTILPAPVNTAPIANPGESYLGAVNTAIQFDGSFSSDPENDPLTYAWIFGDGATGTGVTPTHSYTAPGVYNVCLTVNDGSLDAVQACTLAVVYDSSAGFVTGGGSINSPAGAYKADEALTGKATFGFVSKYQKGARIPTGTTAFAFDLAGLSFSSQSYEWLVVNKTASNAQFKGSGLINGTADPNGKAYNFMLWAADGSPDTFRIRIWWEDAAGEHVVYDNGVAQAIGSGNIVVHVSK